MERITPHKILPINIFLSSFVLNKTVLVSPCTPHGSALFKLHIQQLELAMHYRYRVAEAGSHVKLSLDSHLIRGGVRTTTAITLIHRLMKYKLCGSRIDKKIGSFKTGHTYRFHF